MPADSAKPECDQAVNHLELEGFSRPRNPDASLETSKHKRKRDPAVHSPALVM